MAKAIWKNYTKDQLQELAKESKSNVEWVQKMGYSPRGGGISRVVFQIKQAYPDIDISHFTGQGWLKEHTSIDILKNNPELSPSKRTTIFKALEKERGHKCEKCGLSEWNNQPIPLEVHHIDGDTSNNSLNNLLLLCPNCHAQTNTYRGKNINKGSKEKVPEEVLVQALRDCKNIRQALILVGLAPKGANYQRMYSLCVKYPDLAKKYIDKD